MSAPPSILSIGTAVPGAGVRQEDMLARVLDAVPDDKRLRAFVKNIYRRSGIETRHSVISDFTNVPGMEPFIPRDPGPSDGPTVSRRNGLFVKEAPPLAAEAAGRALKKLPGLDRSAITHLVTASCTGFSAPGFDLAMINSLGLSRKVSRFHIGFMGCLAAFPALKLARSICMADGDAVVLIACAELCSLHYRHHFDTGTLVANSLFSDGASAAVVTRLPLEPSGGFFRLRSFTSAVLPNTAPAMSWMIGDHGFDMELSQSVPGIIERNLPGLLDDAAKDAGAGPVPVDAWAVHPGGRAILDRSLKALRLDRKAFEASYSVLKKYGNMSSATLLFVLEELLEREEEGTLFAAGFGPGLTAETAFMEIDK